MPELNHKLQWHLFSTGFTQRDWMNIPDDLQWMTGDRKRYIATYKDTYSIPNEPESRLEIITGTVSTGLGSAFPQRVEVQAYGRAIPFIKKMLYGENHPEIKEGDIWTLPQYEIVKFRRYLQPSYYGDTHPTVSDLIKRQRLMSKNSLASSVVSLSKQLEGPHGKFAHLDDWYAHIEFAEQLANTARKNQNLNKLTKKIENKFSIDPKRPSYEFPKWQKAA